jgi:hypothetical protein
MASKPKRARTAQRQANRVSEKLVIARARLRVLEPGGVVDRPMVVESASLVELKANDERCERCGSAMRAEEHRAVLHERESVREVDVRCVQCGRQRTVYYRITPNRAN